MHESTDLFSLVKHNSRSGNSISPGTITNFLQDSDGDLWIGSDGGGLNLKNHVTGKITTFKYDANNPNGINCDKVISIIEDEEGYIWLATYGGGINRYDKRTKSFKHYTHDPDNHYSISNDKVKVVFADTNGNIWAGTYGSGISVLNKKTGKFKHYRSVSYDPTTVLSDWISIIYEDKEGDIWIGSYGGLNRFIPKNQTFKGYHNEEGNDESLSHNYVVDIFEDSKNNFWVGTSGGGLCLFDKRAQTFEVFNTTDKKMGLPNNNIQSIIEDDRGLLWIATKNGITKYNLFRKAGQPYSASDGLPSSTFYYNAKFKTSAGKILLGANNGYMEINPFDAKKNRTKPPIVITQFKLFNKIVPIGTKKSPLKQHIKDTDQLTLKHNQNSFSFHFAALNFINPERNQFKYQLTGFDKEWIEAGNNRTASYTNIDPGEYTFKVIGSNNDGYWNEKGTEIKITIIPPFWGTWWFRTGVAVFIVILIFVIFKLRIQQIKHQNHKLEKEVAIRTEEVSRQKTEIENQHIEMQESITVGKIIQDSILPPLEMIQADFPDSFVYYEPKDIVSGDFYWYHSVDDEMYIAAIDCTGHGVAGAFMSLIGYNILSDISKDIKGLNPAQVLDRLNLGVIQALRQRSKDSLSRDGMDITLVKLKKGSNKIEYAGAMNNLYVIRKNSHEVESFPADKFSIGIPRRGDVKNFTHRETEISEGDCLYMFSDGYADQFGGDDGQTKFMYGRFRELLVGLNDLPAPEKHQIISDTLKNWMRETEQLDDILVIGLKV